MLFMYNSNVGLRITGFDDLLVRTRNGNLNGPAVIIGTYEDSTGFDAILGVFVSVKAANDVMQNICMDFNQGHRIFDFTDSKFDSIRYHEPKTVKEEGG